MIEAHELAKTFFVHEKEPGLIGSLRSLVSRKQVPREAVSGVSFTVGGGELVGLVGANGAGKTTLVKMLTGIIVPTSGAARVLGFDPWRRDDRLRRQLALIMGQKAQLWWDLPAADSFLLLREIYQIPADRYRQTLGRLAAMLEVDRLLKVQLRRLSLGERMKMELIATLLHEPRVVFLDEPTIGLDLTAQRAIRDFLLSYQREYRPAMILTSHYMEDIERLAERILILRRGELVFDGPLAEVARGARNKVVTVHLRADAEPPGPTLVAELSALLAPAGKVLSAAGLTVRLEVPREEVSAVAAHLLGRLSVADLSIEEEEIGRLIETLMRDPLVQMGAPGGAP